MRLLSVFVLTLGIAAPAGAASVDDTHAVAMARPQELIIAPGMSPTARDRLLIPSL